MEIRNIVLDNKKCNQNIDFDTLNYTFDREMVYKDLINKHGFSKSNALTWCQFNYEVLKNEIRLRAKMSEEQLSDFSLIDFYEEELNYLTM